jgi:large subunit ribosomal protein L9
MEVILLQKVANLGNIGDKVKVKPGYGRNFLLPSGKAAVATAKNLKKFEERRGEFEKIAADELSSAQTRAAQLENFTLNLTAKAGAEGKLFGSVGTSDIAEALTKLGDRDGAQRGAPRRRPAPSHRRASGQAAPAYRRRDRAAGRHHSRGLILADAQERGWSRKRGRAGAGPVTAVRAARSRGR